jgi:hypothetical protein
MSKPVPPKDQARQPASRPPASPPVPARPAPAPESKPPQVSRAKVIEPPTLPREQIAVRAYQIWMERGRSHGSDLADWLEAERQLLGQP